MKLKYVKWRNAALAYLQEHGPTNTRDLYDLVTNSEGGQFKHGPRSVHVAAQLLRLDSRFIYSRQSSLTANMMGTAYRASSVWEAGQ